MSNQRQHRLIQALMDDPNTETVSEIANLLDTLPEPTIHEQHKASVIASMMSELPQAKTRYQQVMEWYPMALLLSQVRIIHRGLWVASATILLLGVIVTLSSAETDLSVFSAIAPVVAAVSVAALYDENVRAMLEIESSTRASARLLLLARMTLVFGFNLVLALIGSIILALVDSQTLLIPLILSWLAPMTFLTGLAFFLSIVARDTLFAMSTSLVLWIMHILTRADSYPNIWLHALSLPGLSDTSNRPILLLSGTVLTMIALWIVGILDRKTGHLA